jgi:hypothetical protein
MSRIFFITIVLISLCDQGYSSQSSSDQTSSPNSPFVHGISLNKSTIRTGYLISSQLSSNQLQLHLKKKKKYCCVQIRCVCKPVQINIKESKIVQFQSSPDYAAQSCPVQAVQSCQISQWVAWPQSYTMGGERPPWNIR